MSAVAAVWTVAQRRPRVLAATVALVIAAIVLAQGISAPFVKDAEPQAAEWIQDVAAGRNLLIPRDYYGALARKPPLFYWVAGAITAVTGGKVDEVRARVVSIVAGAAVALAVMLWAQAFLDPRTGRLAFLFLLASYAFASRGTLALEDMLLVALMFGAWCLIYEAVERGPSHLMTAGIGVLLGLGVLTKGPVAIVLPALGGLIYLLVERRSLREVLGRPWPWIALAIAAAIALVWYVPALLRSRELARIILQENAGHFLPASAGGTGEAARPFYYIAMRTLGGTVPLNFVLPALLAAFAAGSFLSSARKPLLFQASFVIAILIFFSTASAKRDDYVLPAIPSLAILFAALFTSLEPFARTVAIVRDVGAMIAAALMVAGLLAAVTLTALGHPDALLTRMGAADRAALGLFLGYLRFPNLLLVCIAIVIAVAVMMIFVGVRTKRPEVTGAGLGGLSLLGVLVFTALVRPQLARERTLKFAAADIRETVDGAAVCGLGDEYELSFYLGREVPHAMRKDEVIVRAQPAYLFAYASALRRAPEQLRERTVLIREWPRVGRQGAAALYRIEPDLKPDAGEAR
jgi:4-amino-4-deoxy-L-arabinose transferase-like glycosyltransferase